MFTKTLIAALLNLHGSPSLLAIGFSVLLVLSLVAVEEIDLRHTTAARSDADPSIVMPAKAV